MTCHQLVKNSAKTVDICDAADCCIVPHCLLWRHVTRCPQNIQRARHRALRFHQPRQSEVSEVRFAFSIEQNVSRFNVAMQNSVLMRVMNSACHLRD